MATMQTCSEVAILFRVFKLLRVVVAAVAVVVVLLCAQPSPTHASAFAGPYVAFSENMYPCEDGESSNQIVMNLRSTKFDVRKQKVLQIISGNVSIFSKEGVSDVMWSRVRLDTWSNMHWIPNAFIFNFKDKACSNLRTHAPDAYRVLFKKNPYSHEDCVIPARTYTIESEQINWTFPKFPIMPYGHWRVHITLGRLDKVLLCHNMEGHTVPKN